MKTLVKVNKKVIALLMALMVLLSSLTVAFTVYAAGVKYKLMYQNT